MFKEDLLLRLSNFSCAITSVLNLEQLANVVIEWIEEIFQVKRVSLMLLDKARKDLFIWATSEQKEELKEVRVEFGQVFAGWVAKDGKPLLVKNVDSEFPAFSKTKLGRYQSKSFIISPLKIQDKTIGVINLTERQGPDVFSEEDTRLLSLVNAMIALQVERIQLLEQVENLSTMDSLTGLVNHRYFQERLNEEIDRVQRYRRPCSLIILDIDNFRQYNEDYGYAMGDRFLAEMADVIKNNVRKVDMVARFGGEEFAVLLADTGKKQAGFVAEKLREKIASSVFVEKRKSSLGMTRLTVSVGVAEYNIRNTKEEFVQQAQDALLAAKQKGRNRVEVFK